METSCIIDDQKMSTALWETPYGALCLQPPIKKAEFSSPGKNVSFLRDVRRAKYSQQVPQVEIENQAGSQPA